MTTCETLTHGTCVFLSQRHRFGTDAMLLADFCRPRRAEFAADLCGGCGEGGGRFFVMWKSGFGLSGTYPSGRNCLPDPGNAV